MSDNEKITGDASISDTLVKYPKTVEVFAKFGFHCLGCVAASYESIRQGAEAHGIDTDKFVADLNKCILEKDDDKKD